MPTLTRAELAHYPGQNLTEQLIWHDAEARGRRAPARGALRTEGAAPAQSARKMPSALPLFARIDVRRFPGVDREERVMHYLIAHLPRAEHWSRESLRALATRLVATADIVE